MMMNLEELPQGVLLGEVFWFLDISTALEIASVSSGFFDAIEIYKILATQHLVKVLEVSASRRVKHVIRKLDRREITLSSQQKLLALERLYNVNRSLPFEWHRKALKGARGMNLILNKEFCLYLSFYDLAAQTLPESFSFLKNITSLAASHTRIIGKLPRTPWLTFSTTLRELDLSCNKIYGPLPVEFFSLSQLSYLSLHDNRFCGTLSENFGKLTNLIHCHLFSNRFGGSLPFSIGNLLHLKTLWLHDNQFSHQIPFSIGNCIHLEWISLRDNEFSGIIPHTLGQLTHLKFLYLQRNALQGIIPSSLGNCTQLKELRLQDNPYLDLSSSAISKLPKSLTKCLNKHTASIHSPVYPNTHHSSLFSNFFRNRFTNTVSTPTNSFRQHPTTTLNDLDDSEDINHTIIQTAAFSYMNTRYDYTSTNESSQLPVTDLDQPPFYNHNHPLPSSQSARRRSRTRGLYYSFFFPPRAEHQRKEVHDRIPSSFIGPRSTTETNHLTGPGRGLLSRRLATFWSSSVSSSSSLLRRSPSQR